MRCFAQALTSFGLISRQVSTARRESKQAERLAFTATAIAVLVPALTRP